MNFKANLKFARLNRIAEVTDFIIFSSKIYFSNEEDYWAVDRESIRGLAPNNISSYKNNVRGNILKETNTGKEPNAPGCPNTQIL